MIELPTSPEQVEAVIRESVAQRVRQIEGTGHVFTRLRLIASKQAYVEMLGVQTTDDETEIICTFIDFAGIEETFRGCEEDPIYKLLYSVRLVHEFEDERADGSCSAKDFAATVMRLRQALLRDRDLGVARVYAEGLSQQGRARLEFDGETYTGAVAHVADFILKVEVTPYG